MNNVEGKDLVLMLNDSLIACCTDIDIAFDQTFMSTRNALSTGWQQQLPDQRSFNISGSGLVVFAGRNVWYVNGFQTPTLVSFRYGTMIGAYGNDLDGYWSGNAWIQTYGETSQGSGFAVYNFELIGDGEPTFQKSTGIGSMGIETGDPVFKIR